MSLSFFREASSNVSRYLNRSVNLTPAPHNRSITLFDIFYRDSVKPTKTNQSTA